MFHRRAVIGGLIGGAAGAILWAGVVLVTNYEVGWIALAVGAMVGFGVATGNRGVDHAPGAAGALAVAITLLAIPAGKYAAIQLSFPSDAELVEMFAENAQNEEYVVSFVADAVAAEFKAAGRPVQWPAGVDPSAAATRVEYPPDVWAEAEARWAAMSDTERGAFGDDVEASTRANVSAQLPQIRAAIRDDAFVASFGPMDLLFFGLAVVTAFGMAAGGRKTAAEVAQEFEEALLLAMIQVMLADGRADEGEKQVVRDICASVAGVNLGEQELEREIALAMSGERDISLVLGELAPYLNESGKELITKSAFLVAAADGEFEEEERVLISSIALSLGVTEEHLQRIIASLTGAAEPAEPTPA